MPPRVVEPILHDDGLHRCPWPGTDPLYVAYHDEEWGAPEWDDRALFEKLMLDGFQAGLSWITILRKREAFRAAFDGFEPEKIARYDARKSAALMADSGIVRNRQKIDAAIANAQVIRDEAAAEGGAPQGLDSLLWSFAPPIGQRHSGLVRATSPESVAMAKELKRRGFRFLGPTTCYALMQALGMVNDHAEHCWLAEPGA